MANSSSPDGYCRIIRLRNGRILDAHDYGYKAWPIRGRRRG